MKRKEDKEMTREDSKFMNNNKDSSIIVKKTKLIVRLKCKSYNLMMKKKISKY